MNGFNINGIAFGRRLPDDGDLGDGGDDGEMMIVVMRGSW